MNRTYKSDENIYFFDGRPEKFPAKKAFFQKPVSLPVKSGKEFYLLKNLHVPKQVNDKVYVSFSGNAENAEFFAGSEKLSANDGGLYEITPMLDRGRAAVTLTAGCGCVENFLITVKRTEE